MGSFVSQTIGFVHLTLISENDYLLNICNLLENLVQRSNGLVAFYFKKKLSKISTSSFFDLAKCQLEPFEVS